MAASIVQNRSYYSHKWWQLRPIRTTQDCYPGFMARLWMKTWLTPSARLHNNMGPTGQKFHYWWNFDIPPVFLQCLDCGRQRLRNVSFVSSMGNGRIIGKPFTGYGTCGKCY